MVAERLTRAFWPLWSVVMVALVPVFMGWQDILPVEAVWAATVVCALALVLTLWFGVRRFAWPTRSEAEARLDATMPGRPIAALRDRQAIGRGDAASEAVWAAHVARMAERSRTARAVEPDLRLSSRDPFGLRYIALLGFSVALLFGSVWRAGTMGDLVTTGNQTLANGAVWEGWIEPPAYTGKPSLYLADIPQGDLLVPAGSTVTLRLYGDVGDLAVSETISGRPADQVGAASDAQQSFVANQNGTLSILGSGGGEWDIVILPDVPPVIELTGPMGRDADGQLKQPFAARDDYAVESGTATFALDAAGADRRYGLAADPDPRPDLVLDLPMPFSGDRSDFADTLVDDLSEHPFANLPVLMTLHVTDALGQETATDPMPVTLPGRRFFQPMARVVAEQRRDLLWAKSNAPRVAQVLRAVSNRPDDVFPNETTYLRLRVAIRRLEAMTKAGLTDEGQDEIAKALWDLAVQLEDGTLADARERLRRAQEQLAEAMRNGASPEEIQRLMQELRAATDAYMQMLADNMDPSGDGTDQPDMSQNTQEFTMDELQALMDRIQQLMEEGRMAEAEQLMEQLNQLLENMRITQGDGSGDGPRTRGEQSMQDLSDTLREQQDLSDQAFRDLQDQFNRGLDQQQQNQQDQGAQGQQQGQAQGETQGQGQEGQDPTGEGEDTGRQGQGQGVGNDAQQGQQNDQGAGGEGDPDGDAQQAGPQGLAERQQALRDLLEQQRRNLPSLNGEEADNARRALERAEGAMDGAEEALRGGRLAEAIDKQAEAMDALRDGMRSLGEAMAENRQQQEPGQGTQDGDTANRVEPARRDPLGRQLGTEGQMGSDQNILQGEDVYRRAEDLLNEIRRRSADQDRPQLELDYLKRLLERF